MTSSKPFTLLNFLKTGLQKMPVYQRQLLLTKRLSCVSCNILNTQGILISNFLNRTCTYMYIHKMGSRLIC